MHPFWRKISCNIDLHVVSDETKLDSLTENEDAIVAADNVISVADLIEDEMILAMPMIPRHEEGQCPETDYRQEGIVLRKAPEAPEAQSTYRPFADLAKAIDKQNS
jgi:uncharacterized protein